MIFIYKRVLASVILACSLLIVNSCKVSVDPLQPDLTFPEKYRSSGEADSTEVNVMPWRENFKEIHLKALLDSAVYNNLDLKVAIKNMDAANQMLKQSKLGYLPSISLGVTGSSNRPSDNSLDGLTLSQFLGKRHVEDYTASVGISWEIDIWGKVRNQKEESLAAFLQTEEVKKAIQTQLISEVAQGYYNLLLLDEKLRIAKKNEELNSHTLKMIKLQFEAGHVNSLAVQQADAQKSTAASLVPKFEQEILIQENAINLLIGKMPGSVKRASSIENMFPLEAIRSGVPSSLLSMRPDVKQAELEILRANALLGIQKTNMYPALTITAQGGTNSFQTSNWFNIPSALFGNVLGGVTQPIFQKRKLKTQYELAKIEQEKAVIVFRRKILVAVGEVSGALIKIDKLNEEQFEVDKRSKILQNAVGNADMLFKNGMANYLEVITAQANVLQSQLQSAEIKRAQLDASVELYRSIGGGWK